MYPSPLEYSSWECKKKVFIVTTDVVINQIPVHEIHGLMGKEMPSIN